MYTFLAKQGQHNQVARLLTARYGIKPRLTFYDGKRGKGILISLQTSESHRSVDRFLYSQGVPGAKSRRNKYRVIRKDYLSDVLDLYWSENKIKLNEVFILVYKRKMRKAKLVYHPSGCSCCYGETTVEFL